MFYIAQAIKASKPDSSLVGGAMETLHISRLSRMSWGWEARWEGGWVIVRPVPGEGGAGGALLREARTKTLKRRLAE